MKKNFLGLIILAAMAACTMPAKAEGIMSSNSLIYDNSTTPIIHFVNPNVKSEKAGSATCTTYLMVYNTGKCGIADAMNDNDIKRVHHIDRDIKSYLGGVLYRQVTLWVYGEQ